MKIKVLMRILACVLVAALALFALAACGDKEKETGEKEPDAGVSTARVYGSETLGVILNGDMTFAANLYHGVVKSGTYSEITDENGVTAVTYTVGGEEFTGTIVNDVLTIPHEWDDAHGHGSTFALAK